MAEALPRTRYLVTPKAGRLGKARQIAPFEIEVKSLPHHVDKLSDEICRHVARYAKTKGTEVVLEVPSDNGKFYGDVYSSHSMTSIGRIKVEQIEED